jgi:transcriptional regulator with XRE-family HTH domain
MKKNKNTRYDCKVGQRLARYRRQRGMSQSYLAEAMNVSRSLIKHIERGRAAIGPRERVERFSLVLRCKPADLLQGDDEKRPAQQLFAGAIRAAKAVDAFAMLLMTDEIQQMSAPAIGRTSKD